MGQKRLLFFLAIFAIFFSHGRGDNGTCIMIMCLFPWNINIMVTGHSMGGAMASFCGLDLVVIVTEGEENVQVMTFGQPRVGNAAFASYYSLLVPNTFRIIHDHDMVPHLPPYFYFFPQKTYHHFPTEVWVRDLSFANIVLFSEEKVCDNTGEDPTCSRYEASAHMWLVLEYCVGGDLRTLLQQKIQSMVLLMILSLPDCIYIRKELHIVI